MPTWPVSLPQEPLIDSYSAQLQNNVIRSAMSAGPAKTRRRFTAGVEILNVSFIMTEAQKDTFEAFFYNDIGHGALEFDFTHPETGAIGSFRIDTSNGAPTKDALTNGLWRISLSLEAMP